MMRLFYGTKLLIMAAVLTIAPVLSVNSKDSACVYARPYSDVAIGALAAVGVYVTYKAFSALSSWITSWYQPKVADRKVLLDEDLEPEFNPVEFQRFLEQVDTDCDVFEAELTQ